MTMPWTEYVIRSRAEGWRWGWTYNQQLKTDPAMLPPIGEPFVRTHEPSDLDRPYPILPPLPKGTDNVSPDEHEARALEHRDAGSGAVDPAP